jgi:hypothetical protein
MRRPFRIILTIVATLAIACVVLVAFIRFVLFRNSCDRFETVLSKDPNGRSVNYVFQACTTIGTVTEGWVDLILPTGHRVHLLTFAPWGGEVTHDGLAVKGPFQPSAIWVGPTNLRISIGTVGKVIRRRQEADGVHVTYDVGMELYK